MSSAYTTETLYCEACKAITVHNTAWHSEKPNEIEAQCFHFGQRMLSGLTRARRIGKRIYWFLQDREASS